MVNNLTIRQRIGWAFAAMTLILAVAILICIRQTSRTDELNQNVFKVVNPRLEQLTIVRTGLYHAMAASRGYVLTGLERLKEEFASAWKDELFPGIDELKYLQADDRGRAELASIKELLTKYHNVQEQIHALHDKPENLPAHLIERTTASDHIKELESNLRELMGVEMAQSATTDRRHLLVNIANAQIATKDMHRYVENFLSGPAPAVQVAFEKANSDLTQSLKELVSSGNALNESQREFLKNASRFQEQYKNDADQIFKIRSSSAWNMQLDLLENQAVPLSFTVKERLSQLLNEGHAQMEQAQGEAIALSRSLVQLEWTILAIGIGFSVALGFLITTSISNKLSTQTRELRVASEQLKNVSSEQLQGVTEQTAATSEIVSTISELSAMAQSVMQRCQQVTALADAAVDGCHEGAEVVTKAQQVMAEIKGQIERIVQHMLDLGRKSQQINVAVEIIRELSDQTTILSFNAAIEAASAGEAGHGFAVVADQVGKLADRAKEATREVRTIVDEIQRSTNTTIMATEDALKAVDRGLDAQSRATTVVNDVNEKINVTLEAAREIELSSGQQASAAEQVRHGMTDILSATKQTEQSSTEVASTARTLTSTAQNLEAI